MSTVSGRAVEVHISDIYPTLLGTAIGGLIAAGATIWPQRLRRRSRERAALRFVRNDFYAGQAKIAHLIMTGDWWKDDLELASLAEPEHYGAIASRLLPPDWDEIAGGRRHLKRIEGNRWGAVPPQSQLWQDYKLLDNGRRTIVSYDRGTKFKHHRDYYEIAKLMKAAGAKSSPKRLRALRRSFRNAQRRIR